MPSSITPRAKRSRRVRAAAVSEPARCRAQIGARASRIAGDDRARRARSPARRSAPRRRPRRRAGLAPASTSRRTASIAAARSAAPARGRRRSRARPRPRTSSSGVALGELARRVPRTISSWSFVSSRQTRDRALAGRARRARRASPPTRRGDSNATSVSSAAQQRLELARSRGRKPTKRQVSAGRPLATSAVSAALGPGQHLDGEARRDAPPARARAPGR